MNRKAFMNKSVLCTIAIIFIAFGSIGFFLSSGSGNRAVRYLETQLPLYEITAVAVDSRGHIYYGSQQNACVQVYDNEGKYLYGFSFPTGNGYFTFFIDEDDNVHAASQRVDKTFVFHEGQLIDSQKYEHIEILDIVSSYEARNQINNDLARDDLGNKYVIKNDKKIRVYDDAGDIVRVIDPKSPIWPFHFMVFWAIAATGIIMLFILNKNIFRFMFRNPLKFKVKG